MGQGIYKDGVEIEVTYQAVNCAIGKTVTMDVYGEDHVKDDPKSVAEMTEIGSTGRYYGAFTPDAEGIWNVEMYNTSDSNGKVVKQYAVAGHDVDSIGDAVGVVDGKVDTIDSEIAAIDTVVDAIQTVTDAESGVKIAVDALQDFDPDLDPVAVVTEVTGHTPQTGDSFALAEGGTGFVAIDTVVDGIQTDLDNETDGLGALKTLIDGVGTPAMVG